VRLIDQVTELVTKEAVLEMSPQDGELKADPENDLLKVSLINCEGRIFNGFIRGLGMKTGALATSGCWETFGILVVGANEGDMSSAVNRLSELGGGIVLCLNGERLAELPLPIGGLISNLTVAETAERLKAIQEKAEELGFRYPDVSLTVATLTTPAIPFFRISEEGLVDLRKGKVFDLIME
jgi:adenine deaminase